MISDNSSLEKRSSTTEKMVLKVKGNFSEKLKVNSEK